MADNAAQQVSNVFSQAQFLAQTAQTATNSYLSALNAALYDAPTIALDWHSVATPTLPTLGAVPGMPTIDFEDQGPAPEPLAISEPIIDIDEFTSTEPTLVYPTAPTVTIGTAPTIPAVGAVSVPSAPTIASITPPTLLALSTVTTPTLDMRPDFLLQLETIPTLSLLAPTPYSYALGPEYASTLLSSLKTLINTRLAGGTGLPAAVEQAIWDRLRDRETQIAQANEDEVMRQGEALGYQLPPGALSAQLRTAQQAYYDKLSTASRDIGIKQAELEQTNLKDSIAAGMQLEGQLIDYSFKLEQLTFESAKQYAENAIQVHNAAVEQYKALLEGYQTYASIYKTIIDSQLALVEVYKAELQGEQVKAEINTALVQQYKAQIEASMAQVEIYRAQVGGAQALIEIERTKIQAAAESVKAYTATIGAEVAKVEAYKTTIQAESAKVENYRISASAYATKAGIQATKANAEISRYSALLQAKSAEWEGFKAKVGAEAERIRALGLQSSSQLDAYKAGAASITAQAEQQASVWRANIAQYEAGINATLQTAKINNEAYIMTNNARLDAAKTGAQIYAQLSASAYSMMNASASITGAGNMSVNYSYSNDTTAPVTSVTSV